MKRFVTGLVLGLMLSAAGSKAEWAWGDYDELKKIVIHLGQISGTLKRIEQRLPAPPAEAPHEP